MKGRRKRLWEDRKNDTISYFVELNAAKPIQHTVYTQLGMVSKKRPRTTQRRSITSHDLLAQMLLSCYGGNGICEGRHQGETHQAGWELCWYHDVDQMKELLAQGVSEEEVDQKFWNTACREQDSIGLVRRKTLSLCFACLHATVTSHVGEASATAGLMGVMIGGGSLLLVSDRKTKTPAMVGPFPLGYSEKALLAQLNRKNFLPIQMKEGS